MAVNLVFIGKEKIKLIKTVHNAIQDGGNDTIYILPQKQDISIKVVTDNVSTRVNSDGTFTIKQKIHPERIIKISGRLYMKLSGNWYELEEENE